MTTTWIGSWELFYLTCFAFGLVLCVLSLITGGGHVHTGHLHLPGHGTGHVSSHLSGHLPGAGHASGNGPVQGHGSGVSPFNGFTLTAFLCWFGGVGYLLRTHSGWQAPTTLALAAVGGLLGAGLIFWFLASVLLSHERALTAEETAITGVVGRVTDPLHPGATGEILYTQLGARRSAPARSEDGAVIGRGTEVVVLRCERGIAYVRRWDDLDV